MVRNRANLSCGLSPSPEGFFIFKEGKDEKKVFPICCYWSASYWLQRSFSGRKQRERNKVVVVVPQDPDYLDPHPAAAAGTYEMMFNAMRGC